MFFITHRKIFFWIIGSISVFAVGALIVWRLVFGIEFTGGTIIEVAYLGERPEKSGIEVKLDELDLGKYSLRQSDDDAYIVRLRDINEEEYNRVKEALTVSDSELVEKRRASIGPVIGEELKNKALMAIAIVVVLIALFVAFAFRKVRDEDDGEDAVGVSSWVYGYISILVLAHDVLVPLGMFSVLGHFFGAEVDVLVVMALLTILGYSVNDTIIIFDRVRENLKKNSEENISEEFAVTVGTSLAQTYARSINTAFTTLMVVLALLVFGGPTTMYFALTLSVGVFAGTYSSIALAAPLLVTVEKYQKAKLALKEPAPKAKK
jgi:preprotein translocase subunit SecF